MNNKKAVLVVFSIFLGVMIGLVLASNFDFMQSGHAISPANNSSSYTAPAAGIVGSDVERSSRAFVKIAKSVIPTVVSITSEKVIKVRDPFSNFFGNDEFFRRFFRSPDNGEKEYRQNGLGSGIIVSPDGYILTNYHVVKDADAINVLIDKEKFDAEIIGTDPATDLAIVKIARNNLAAIPFGDSDKLEVGEWVLAIGSPFNLGLEHTVTAGIVSAKGRNLNLGRELTYQDFIQTDAAINPGNSGGALVNIKGELIGINTAIYSGNTGGNVGIGFAIPVNLAKNVMDDLISRGRVVRGYLGVIIGPLDSDLSEALGIEGNNGALIVEVQKGLPADKAGLKKYDVVIEVDGKKIKDYQMLTNLIASYEPDAAINLKIVRDGKIKLIKARLIERDSDVSSSFTPTNVLGKLGIEVTELTDRLADRYGYEGEKGVLVTEVTRGSVSFEKGIRAGDLIVEINREEVRSVRELSARLDKLEAGDIVLFQIKQKESIQFIAMKVPE